LAFLEAGSAAAAALPFGRPLLLCFAESNGRTAMIYRCVIGSLGVAAALAMAMAAAQAFDETKYPNFKGQWDRTAAPRWVDASKAPLTAEYRAIYEANVKDQESGGQGDTPTYTCVSPGMPRVMNAYEPFEVVVTPQSTHFLMDHIHDSRRIFTDGRDWPKAIEPSFVGYSIGKWIDEDGDGRYGVLEVETRGLKGPRSYDSTGIPFHHDNQTIIKERIFLDKADPNTFYDEITVIDHALTAPWTVTKKYVRKTAKQPMWREAVCAEGNTHILIGTEAYMLSAGGDLMPVRKDQAPPDLKYFNRKGK
jgi:hypothetical protein